MAAKTSKFFSALEVPNTYCLIIATGQCHIARWREAKLIYTALVSDELNGSLSRSRVYEMNDVIALGTKDALRISRQRRFAVMTANRCNHLKMGDQLWTAEAPEANCLKAHTQHELAIR
jgi:hypothetical protein